MSHNKSFESVTLTLSQRLGVKSGQNKIAECLRLLDEISRKEEKQIEEILNEVLNETQLIDKEHWHFDQLKKGLVKRRYPLTKKVNLSKVLLHPLNQKETKEARKHASEFVPSHIHVQKSWAETPIVQRALSLFPEVSVSYFEGLKALYQEEAKNWKGMEKKRLIFSGEDYDFIEPCPCTKCALNCNYHVIKLGMGCPFDCSYCFLQEYQNLKGVILPTNPERFLEALAVNLEKNPDRILRIGTGEYTDSLALDHITEYSKILVPFFKDKKVIFELKTKSDNIENLLNLDHGGKTVISWSLSPTKVAEAEDWDTASVEKRLIAAQKCQEAGYPIGFHFDPMIEYDGWEQGYQELIDQVYSMLKPPLKWLSLGSLRFAPHLKTVAEERHPQSKLYLGELFVDEQDRKMRYPEERRAELYKIVLDQIRKHDPTVPTYLCMESKKVWDQVFDHHLPYTGRMDSWISATKI